MIRLRFLTASVAVLAMLAGATIHATTVVALSNRALTENASVIAIGRCVEVRSAWEGGRSSPSPPWQSPTFSRASRATVTVVLPGGVDANRRFPVAMVYAGAPQIAMNEEVFLFLVRRRRSRSGLTVAGFSQGKFSIVDENGRRARGVAQLSRPSRCSRRPAPSAAARCACRSPTSR